MARYLVTGGCGFIGSHLVDALLEEGHHVTVLDNLSTGKESNIPLDRCTLVVGDILDTELVNTLMQTTDGCFHLAAIASVEKSNLDWAGTHKINLTGAINVFNAARPNLFRDHAVPVVYASSAAVYGDNPVVPISETSLLQPLSAYGADKLGCEQHARVAHLVHGVPSTGLRFFNVYGPRQDPNSPYSGVISIFANKACHHEPITIYGSGEQTRDFVYVLDVVHYLVAAMQNTKDQSALYNVCTGIQTSVTQLAHSIVGISYSPSTIQYKEERSGDIFRSVGNPDKVQKALSYIAQVPLKDGLVPLLTWCVPPLQTGSYGEYW